MTKYKKGQRKKIDGMIFTFNSMIYNEELLKVRKRKFNYNNGYLHRTIEEKNGHSFWLRKLKPPKIIVYNPNGSKSNFTNKELDEIINNPKEFEGADNLPKWMTFIDMRNERISFNKAYENSIRTIKRLRNKRRRTVIKFYRYGIVEEYDIIE